MANIFIFGIGDVAFVAAKEMLTRGPPTMTMAEGFLDACGGGEMVEFARAGFAGRGDGEGGWFCGPGGWGEGRLRCPVH